MSSTPKPRSDDPHVQKWIDDNWDKTGAAADPFDAAREAMAWSEEESLEPSAAPWYFAKAQAYAAIAQAEAQREQAAQLTRIADALYAKSNNYSLADLASALEDRLEI